jgi:DNA-binding transcriptional ArsR family regulator
VTTTRSLVLDSSEQLAAITHPTRLRILEALREPDSAAGVARRLGEPRQRLNHHVRELVKAGLLVEAGERRKGNFVEQLYRAAAGTFVLSPRLTWGDGERLRAIADQVSLGHLVTVGERLQRDAAVLLDRAAFDGVEIPAAAVEASVRFATPEARAAFLDDYLQLTARLIEQHASGEGEPFTVALVVHPTPEETS